MTPSGFKPHPLGRWFAQGGQNELLDGLAGRLTLNHHQQNKFLAAEQHYMPANGAARTVNAGAAVLLSRATNSPHLREGHGHPAEGRAEPLASKKNTR